MRMWPHHPPLAWRTRGADKIADKGYFTMSDDWFTEYVYEVAVPKALLPAEYLKALEEPATMLPAWGSERWPKASASEPTVKQTVLWTVCRRG